MIEIIDKHTAKLIVNIGSGKTRKRRTKKVTYSGKRELNNLYREFEDECKRAPSSKITVNELVDSYIKHKELLAAAKRVNSRFAGISAGNLIAYQIEDFIAEMANSGLSAKTIINTISILNSAYDRAVRTGQLASNPCQYVTMPKKKKPEIITFSNDELVTFWNKLNEERLDYKVGYELCLFCGMRRSEVLGLRESDVSIESSSIIVRNTRHRIEGDKDIVQDTKTAQSHRTLAVPEFVIRDIDILMHEHHANIYNNTDYLIQNGETKLVGNLEYRTKLFGDLNGAVFLDAGNVWDFTDEYVEGGKFPTSLKQLVKTTALGTGVGLRYDLGFLVIRLDWGLAIHCPYDTGKSGYFNVPSFSGAHTLHFAVGYPF